jgi:hypothetical protein
LHSLARLKRLLEHLEVISIFKFEVTYRLWMLIKLVRSMDNMRSRGLNVLKVNG